MKLTQKQLRSLVEATVKEAGARSGGWSDKKDPVDLSMKTTVNSMAAHIADIVMETLHDQVDADLVIAKMLEDNADEDIFRPGRREDIEAFSERVAKKAQERVSNSVTALASRVFRRLMEPR